MRTDKGFRGDTRSSALWGRRGESRSSALWGRGGRGALTVFALALVFVVPVVGSAASGPGDLTGAYVPKSLLADAAANPMNTFHVIVQGSKGNSTTDVANAVAGQGDLKRSFSSIAGVSMDLKGGQLLGLSKNPHIGSITPDVATQAAAYENAEMWRDTADVTPLYSGATALSAAPQAPAIAIVDSGVDASKVTDFGTRVVANVDLSSLEPNDLRDNEGHGTMVADVAAGSNPLHKGAAPNAPIVAIKTANKDGQSVTSDVIAAADWILANRSKYNIRVANFSMAGANETSFRFDPLDKAVERLWFAGVTVVVSAGNHGSGTGPVSMSYAPANDPFVITVGATDQHATVDPTDDTTPAWSAYGATMDGFHKPDVSAPGRYMVAAVPMTSTIPTTVPDRVVAAGYVWMSGTSFAAPVVAGAAAQILARHPDWGPDQVKGALMLTSAYLPNAAGGVGNGVGEIDAAAAASLDFTPPDPNEGFKAFVKADPVTGSPTFDQASWASFVAANASWSQANWASASWASASWAQASWASASWSQANWSSNLEGQLTRSAATFTP
jgi:serine protease AprX